MQDTRRQEAGQRANGKCVMEGKGGRVKGGRGQKKAGLRSNGKCEMEYVKMQDNRSRTAGQRQMENMMEGKGGRVKEAEGRKMQDNGSRTAGQMEDG